MAVTICLIACHGGPADHFAVFAKELEKKGCQVQIFASGPAIKKFQDYKINGVISFDSDHLLSEEDAAEQIAKKCAAASVAITDVGHVFDIALQKALSRHAPNVLRLAYYDNPESYVPGGYSAVAAKVMLAADRVLFANANLAGAPIFEAPDKPVDIDFKKRFGVGYYPLNQAEKIAKRRQSEHQIIRSRIFAQYRLEDRGQKLLVYTGGNNEEYFTKAFPAFLRFLSAASQKSDLSNYVFLLQQHPGAKKDNIDGRLFEDWVRLSQGAAAPRLLVSHESSDDVQIAADAMLYYQTSMGPQFVLAGIPAIQVGHNRYEDILVRNHLCATATNENELLAALKGLREGSGEESSYEAIAQALGLYVNWLDRLEQFDSRS